jgi:imidazole glycerol-phosphate synthase subunit HisH
MLEGSSPRVVVVDHGRGNLFSVKNACEMAGFTVELTADPGRIDSAELVILPGVGAFGDAMASLVRLGLVEGLRARASAGKPLVGICLGMQLLMSRSQEFGEHSGLDIVKGDVVRFEADPSRKGVLGERKVPQVGWNGVFKPEGRGGSWADSPLKGHEEGGFMYFVHSYYVRPEDGRLTLATSRYGGKTFCSALRLKNVFGFQFHPERSGPAGLAVYRRLARWIRSGLRTWSLAEERVTP